MNTHQQNQLAMYRVVLRFFEQAGAPLLAVKRIGVVRQALAGVVERIGLAAGTQDHGTAGITKSRTAVKAAAGQKAEVLRRLLVLLTDDAALRGELKTPLSKKLVGKDADLLAYLRKIEEAVDTLGAEDLADAGYDEAVRLGLRADIGTLTATRGAARQVAAGVSAATDTLEDLFGEATGVLEGQLDPLVAVQQLKHPVLVAQYEASRRIVRRAARRRAVYRGVVGYGAPALVYDRREAGVPQPTLSNRSGKGLTLRYYTAAAPTAEPAPGQGVVVKPRSKQQAEYERLGAADAPYLLVVLEQVDGEGRWAVR